jgi:hypothetical protein
MQEFASRIPVRRPARRLGRGRGRRLAPLLVVMAALTAAGLQAPPASARGCITTLPVTVTTTSQYAAAYQRGLIVTVTTRGPVITNLEAGLYTFAGDRLGQGTLKHPLRGSATIDMHLRFPVQAGQYTIYLVGEPNADPSCGPKHTSQVLDLRSCLTRLPVEFPDSPGGLAADYGDYLSFPLRTRGFLIRHVNVSLSSFAGARVGSVGLPALFGTVTVNVPLRKTLVTGSYTVFVTGDVASQPRACGPATAQATWTFQ